MTCNDMLCPDHPMLTDMIMLLMQEHLEISRSIAVHGKSATVQKQYLGSLFLNLNHSESIIKELGISWYFRMIQNAKKAAIDDTGRNSCDPCKTIYDHRSTQRNLLSRRSEQCWRDVDQCRGGAQSTSYRMN